MHACFDRETAFRPSVRNRHPMHRQLDFSFQYAHEYMSYAVKVTQCRWLQVKPYKVTLLQLLHCRCRGWSTTLSCKIRARKLTKIFASPLPPPRLDYHFRSIGWTPLLDCCLFQSFNKYPIANTNQPLHGMAVFCWLWRAMLHLSPSPEPQFLSRMQVVTTSSSN